MPWDAVWAPKYLKELSAVDPRTTELLQRVKNELGGGGNASHAHRVRGHHVLLWTVRRWATRPLFWLRREAHRRQVPVPVPCLTMHVRRSDVVSLGRSLYPMADYVRASGGLSRLRSLGSVVLLADNYAAVDEARGPALAGVKWVVLDRMRGAHDTEKNYHRYAPHVQLASAREEVAWMYAELQLASRCDRVT